MIMTKSKLNSSTKPVAVVGANGYSGLELARILLKHPSAELKACFVRDTKWVLSNDLLDAGATQVKSLPVEQLISSAPHFNAIFLATPAELSIELAPRLKEMTHVIDLSGAFRLPADEFEKYYKFAHSSSAPEKMAHYGLSPWNAIKAKVSDSASPDPILISNPGCYATSCLMALIPLLKNQLVNPTQIVIDAKSGTTGAGRKAKENLLFSEVAGGCPPYKMGEHQHLPEIARYAQMFSGSAVDIQLNTHLLPVRRGIISSIYLRRNPTLAHMPDSEFSNLIQKSFDESYEKNSLVRHGHAEVLPQLLSLRSVVGSARTHISFTVKGDKVYVFSCIDNLLKGAASQAIENWNLLNDWPYNTGLDNLEGNL